MQKARRHTLNGAPTACRRTGSGTLSLLCLRCFSPFPHGTSTLSVSYEYLALADGPAGFTQDYTCPALLRILLSYHIASHKGLSPAMAELSNSLLLTISYKPRSPTTPIRPQPHGFGLFPVRSPLLGESLLFSLPAGTKMFQFPAFASCFAR